MKESLVHLVSQNFKKLINFIQENHFNDETVALNKGKSLSHKSTLQNLNPFLDEGILRVGSRMGNSSFSFKKMTSYDYSKSQLFNRFIVKIRT